MQFKDFYEIPKFKKLDKIGKTIFVFSFLFPALILYTFLHLYFLPFGLDKDYSLEDGNLRLTDEGFFYEEDLKEVLDGTSQIELHTRIPKRNLRTTVSVEGEGLYLIPEAFTEDDVDFNPDYTKKFDENFDYAVIDDYQIEEKIDYLVFKLEYELKDQEEVNEEILFGYKNIEAIQKGNMVEFNVEKVYEDEIETYTTRLALEKDSNTVYFTYKQPGETNGFLEIFSGEKISHRSTIPNKDFNPNNEQYFVFLKKNKQLARLLENIPEELKTILESERYYEKKLRAFSGEIQEFSVGYEYPIKLSKSFGTLRNTPMFFKIVGENAKIENIEINIHREAIWEKL